MKLKINNKEIDIYEAFSFFKAFKGFMLKKNIDHGLIFKTSSIHTFFMLENIDIIQVDKNYNVIRYYKNMKKNKVVFPKKNVYYTIELPCNTIKNIKKGDNLMIS